MPLLLGLEKSLDRRLEDLESVTGDLHINFLLTQEGFPWTPHALTSEGVSPFELALISLLVLVEESYRGNNFLAI